MRVRLQYAIYCLLFRKRGIGWRQSCSRCDKNGRSGSERPVEHRFYQVLALSDNRFLGFGNHPENRIQIFNQSKVLATYSDFPVLDEKEENNRSLWGNLASFGVSSDEKHIVITTGIGAAFEILSLSGEKISHKLVKGFYAPKYSIAQGAVPVCVVVCPETVVGFNALHVADDCFTPC